MATRRKPSGFTAPGEETSDFKAPLDENGEEMFETISHIPEEPAEEKEVEPRVELVTPAILPEIVPTEDAGPRFAEDPVIPKAESTPKPQAPVAKTPPKRHPRNIPKFSHYI